MAALADILLLPPWLFFAPVFRFYFLLFIYYFRTLFFALIVSIYIIIAKRINLAQEEKAELLNILLTEIKLFRDGTVIFVWRGENKDITDAMALARLEYEAENEKLKEKEKAKKEILEIAKKSGLNIDILENENNTYNLEKDEEIKWKKIK